MIRRDPFHSLGSVNNSSVCTNHRRIIDDARALRDARRAEPRAETRPAGRAQSIMMDNCGRLGGLRA